MNSQSVLLVEDNPDDEILALKAFEKSGIINEIFVVRNGREALDYLFAQGPYANRHVHELPAVMLLDLNLPHINGLEVLKRVREHETTRHLPVVILTSSNHEADLVRSYDLGANSYIRKPVDFNEFVTTAGQLGKYWLLFNELPY